MGEAHLFGEERPKPPGAIARKGQRAGVDNQSQATSPASAAPGTAAAP